MTKNIFLIKTLSLAFFAKKKGLKIAIAESCTSGLLADHLSALAGSSTWFDFGIICYSNQSKINLLSVSASSIREYGSVSKVVASEMLCGLEKISRTKKPYLHLYLSITGIAGPTGATKNKERGLVWYGFQAFGQKVYKKQILSGSRMEIRYSAVSTALNKLISESARKNLRNN